MRRKTILFAMTMLIGMSMFAVVGCGGDSPRATSAPTATPTPAPRVSVKALFAEREANANRFDDERKGKWVTVYGKIERIESGKVNLEGDGFLSSAVLEDLSDDEIIPLNRGSTFAATCKVGSYVLGIMYFSDCKT